MVEKILVAFIMLGILTLLYLWDLNIIGEINFMLSSKKLKKIDISQKKIFIPYHGHHFYSSKNCSTYYNTHFDGKVVKMTYILTIWSYIYYCMSIILWIILCLFPSEIFLCIVLVVWASFPVILAFIHDWASELPPDELDFKVD